MMRGWSARGLERVCGREIDEKRNPASNEAGSREEIDRRVHAWFTLFFFFFINVRSRHIRPVTAGVLNVFTQNACYLKVLNNLLIMHEDTVDSRTTHTANFLHILIQEDCIHSEF